MVKVKEFIVEEGIYPNEKGLYWKYDLVSSYKRMIRGEIIITYRRKCREGSLVAFWNTNELKSTYMIYVNKRRTYYYTDDANKAISMFVNMWYKPSCHTSLKEA